MYCLYKLQKPKNILINMQIRINTIQFIPDFIILLLSREIIIIQRDIKGINAKPIILLP